MATQPTNDLLVWANTDVNLPNLAGPNKTEPNADLVAKGWDFKQKPSADEFNYILNNLGEWVEYLRTLGTSENIPSTLVERNASGNFAANLILSNLIGNVTGNLNGNADTATKWKTARTLTATGFATGTATNINGSDNIDLVLSMGSGFTNSKTKNGYTYLPNGLILQWGWQAGGEDWVYTVTLPVTYPNAILNLSTTARSPSFGGGNTDFAAHGDIVSTSTIKVALTSASGAHPATDGVFWTTIGY